MNHLYDEPPPLPPGVPEQVDSLLATAMAKDPADRYPSAAVMALSADAAMAAAKRGAGRRERVRRTERADATRGGGGSRPTPFAARHQMTFVNDPDSRPRDLPLSRAGRGRVVAGVILIGLVVVAVVILLSIAHAST